jgi:hypothetical protein
VDKISEAQAEAVSADGAAAENEALENAPVEDRPSPAEALVPRGLLKLSGSDAMGPNPWTRTKPTAEDFGLAEADMASNTADRALAAARAEMVEYAWRVTSSFLVPIAAVVALYAVTVGDFSFLAPENFGRSGQMPANMWITYLGVSLIIGAIGAHLQTRVNAKAVSQHAAAQKIVKQKEAFAAAKAEWYNDLKIRTTTAFWRQEIPRIAKEKGSTPAAVFSQEVAKLFAAWGWDVKLNQRSDDYGVDMFASGKDGSAIVQCKHIDTGPGVQDVRDLAGCRHAFNADFGLLVSIHPPSATRQNGFFSDKGQLEFWHLGHLLEQCMTHFTKRTGEPAPQDATRSEFLNADGTPIAWQVDEKNAAE